MSSVTKTHSESPSSDADLEKNSIHEEASTIPQDKKAEAEHNAHDHEWLHDPRNARNWSKGKKWAAVSIVSLYTFVSPLTSSMMAPGLPEVAEKYDITSSTIVAMTLSIFLLAFAIGPLFLAPMSEMYGRTWVLHICNTVSIGFNLGCAFAPNVGALIGFRFLAGLSGSAPIAIGSGSIGDLFAEHDRAAAMAIYTLGPLLGPVIGPICGGWIAQTIGTKWVFIVIAGACTVSSALGIPILRETYAPVIRRRIAQKCTDPEEAAKIYPAFLHPEGTIMDVIWLNLTRPVILLTRSLTCFMLSLYMAFMYGIYYLMFTTFPAFFAETYGFGPGIGGLVYLGLGVGFFSATIFGAKFGAMTYTKLAAKNGGVGTPEMRIPALIFGSFFVPVGILWYGWAAQEKTHWIVPILGSLVFGFGLMATFLPISLYLVDTFTYAASATAATSFLRSFFGFLFPLFAQQMFDKLGLGGGNSLLAGLAIVLGIPFPIWLWYNGERIRSRDPLSSKSAGVSRKVSRPEETKS